MSDRVRVGLVGSQFVSTIHAEALAAVPDAEVVAVASPTDDHAAKFAQQHGIPQHFTEYKRMFELDGLDMVVLGLPNHLHCEAVEAAASAGKHVVCEKPFCLNLAEADRMIAACKRAGVKLMYAEQVCFAPKYVRLKELLDSGALGAPTLVKHAEKHDGPHSPHFWDVDRSGGGVMVDMGCHAIEFFRWLLGKPKITSVYAQLSRQVHTDRTRGDDNGLLILEFDNGCVGLAEESWSKPGGMDDRAEVYGSKGVAYADLFHGNAIRTYSDAGYDYAAEKAGTTTGWTFTMWGEVWNQGYPQEMAHFVDCVKHDKEPIESGEDGRVVMEVLLAAYESARTGGKVALPFETDAHSPYELWQPS